MFEYDDGDIKMNTDLDMNNHKIINLSDGSNDTDAVNKRQLDTVNNLLNTFTNYLKHIPDYDYIKTFKQYYSMTDPNQFTLNKISSGVVIIGINNSFNIGANRYLADFDMVKGFQINNGYITLDKQINQNTNYTMFVSLLLDRNFEIYFTNNQNAQYHFYPSYFVTNSQIMVKTFAENFSTSFTSEYSNKQTILWMTFNSSLSLYKMGISNYNSSVSKTINTRPNFDSRYIKIIYDGYIKKFGFIDKFIDIDSLEHHKIMLHELKNGTFLHKLSILMIYVI